MIIDGGPLGRSRLHGHGRGGRPTMSRSKQSDNLVDLERRVYTTYEARLRTANRTRLRGHLWNLPLVSSPVVTLIVVIVGLAAPETYSDKTEVLVIVLSVLTLIASIIVPSARYEVNSERLFHAYRRLQRLATEVERLQSQSLGPKERSRQFDRANAVYQKILDDTQNHSAADYWGVIRDRNRRILNGSTSSREQIEGRPIPISGRLAIFGSWCLTILPAILALGIVVLCFTLPALEWLVD